MATRSTPMVANRPAARATSALVPTPSVELTKTGSRYRSCGKAKSPPKPPMSPMTSGRIVDRTCDLMRSTASSPAAMSTPASAYVRRFCAASPGRSDMLRGVFQHVLRQLHRHLGGVFPREAGGAEARTRRVDGGDEVLEAEIGDRVDAEVLLDLAHGEIGGEQLGAGTGVDAVEARPLVGRRRHPKVHLGGACVAQHPHHLAGGGAAHDGV